MPDSPAKLAKTSEDPLTGKKAKRALAQSPISSSQIYSPPEASASTSVSGPTVFLADLSATCQRAVEV